jgi:hypothetical protein
MKYKQVYNSVRFVDHSLYMMSIVFDFGAVETFCTHTHTHTHTHIHKHTHTNKYIKV